MQYFFSYYPGEQSITIPDKNLIGHFGPIVLPTGDRERLLNEAFEHPVTGDTLKVIAKPDDNVLIVVDDVLEPTPVVFPFFHVIRDLHAAGVKDANISVLISNANHRASTGAEIDRKIGQEMHKKYKVFQSSGDSTDSMHEFGTVQTDVGMLSATANGHLINATLIVSVSGAYPNRFKGISGSGSLIFPGLASEQTAGSITLRGAEKPSAEVFGMIETPARHAITRLLDLLPAYKFSVDIILDRKLQIAACITGDPRTAYKVSGDTANRIYKTAIPEMADIVVIDSQPFDHNLLQAAHALYAALPMLKPRGEIVLISPLLEALPAKLSALAPNLEDTRNAIIQHTHQGSLHRTTAASSQLIAIAEVLEHVRQVSVVSHGPGRVDVAKYGFALRDTPQAALNEALERVGESARVILITSGGLVIPQLQ
ncbi:MAG: lactate racemase domain-containing protein [Candidatus Kapaibacterium sp.]|jgi:nickel-dependent lactate racemase